MGAREWVADATKYRALNAIPHWRRVLSNFHAYPFTYGGRTYRTIEHVFQARKIVLAEPQRAYEFTVESGTPLGLGDGLEARKARKLVTLSGTQLQEWNRMKDQVMAEAAAAKYKACEEARVVLIATGQAELWHVVPRGQPVRFQHLEAIRGSLVEKAVDVRYA